MHSQKFDDERGYLCLVPRPSTVQFFFFFDCVHYAKTEGYRPYAIDIITHVTERETVGGQKYGYYTAILSRKNDCGLRSLSTAEQFASSFLTGAGSDFTFASRMRKASTGPNVH